MGKNRSCFVIAALSTSALLLVFSGAARAEDNDIETAPASGTGLEIVNQTERYVTGLYISPADLGGFGFNQLSGQTVAPGESVLFEPTSDACLYDFLTVFDDGEPVADYSVDICAFSGGKYTLFEPDGEAGRLVVYNGTDSELRDILIEGASSTRPGPDGNPDGNPSDSGSGSADQPAPDPAPPAELAPAPRTENPAALCENYRNPGLRSQCLEFFAAAAASGDQAEITIDSNRSRTEAASDCTNGSCDNRYSRAVGLLGSYAIEPGKDAWILTDSADLSCDTITRYDITATFANGQRETKRAVNLCGQDDIYFGQPKQGTPVSFTVVNATDQSRGKNNLVLRELYLTPVNGTTWGYNLLAAQLVNPGESGLVSFIDTTDDCTYDVRAVFVNPNQVEHLDPVRWSAVNLCQLDNNALVYGLTAAAQRPAPATLALGLGPKQLVRPKSEICLASSGSSVCQPARRRDSSSRRPWWQVWSAPS
ncbi:MAG TPA: hypothetical protein VLS96_17220 [Nodosilinea sp.]|nr:hypothetical protein [Nodosilinea sp.]